MHEDKPLAVASYELTIEDVVCAGLHVHGWTRQFQVNDLVARNVVLWAVGSGIIGQFILAGLTSSPVAGLTVGVVVGLIYFLRARYVWRSFPHQLRAYYEGQENRSLIGAKELRIYPDGFAVCGPECETRYIWSGIWRVYCTPEYLFVYVAKILVHAVPKKVLTESKVSEVTALIRQHVPAEAWISQSGAA